MNGKFQFNEYINALEIDPNYISAGAMEVMTKNINYVRVYAINDPGSVIDDLDLRPLIKCNTIRILEIHDNFKPKRIDIESVYAMKNLHHLYYLVKCAGIDFSRLRQLEFLFIAYSKKIVNIESLRNLKHLLLISPAEGDCHFPSGLSNLQELRIAGGRLQSLAGIEQLENLLSLELSYCSKLIDGSILGSLPRLNKLHIEKCKRLTDLNFLSKSPSIEHLFASELDSIAFVPEMLNLRYLKFWELKDGNLEYALMSKSLKSIDFSVKKKNYTHTKEEINRLLTMSDR